MALPDALHRAVAQVPRRRRRRHDRGSHRGRRARAGAVGDRRPGSCASCRPACSGDSATSVSDRARGPRRDAAGDGRDHRAPRATRVSRPLVGAARPGVHARPPVHVAVLDAGLDRPAGASPSCCSCRCSPVLVLLPLFAMPDRDHGAPWRPGVERRVEESVAPHDRLARHLFRARHHRAARARRSASTGIGASSQRERRESWDRWYGPIARGAL